MPACHLEPRDKKRLISKVGEDLVKNHGKKKYYRPAEVRRSVVDSGYPIDYVCWAHCIFLTAEEFHQVHMEAGEDCDYAGMKAEVLSDLALGGTFQWPDIDLSWLEWPDIDVSSVFDWFNWN